MRRAYLLALASVVAACHGGGEVSQRCEPGSTVSCECAGGVRASALCGEGGTPGSCACPGVVESAPSSIDFGEVAPGVAREATLLLWTAGAKPIAVTGATIEGSPGFAVGSRPMEVPAGGAGAPVVVSFFTPVPVVAKATLVVKTDAGEVSVPLEASATGPLVTCTEELRWSDAPVGGSSSKQIVCENHGVHGFGDSAIAILSNWENDDAEFILSPPLEDGMLPEGMMFIEVVYQPLDLEDDDITVWLHFERGQEVPVRLVGSAVDASCDLMPSIAHLSGVPGQDLAGELVLRNRSVDAGCRLSRLELDPGCDEGFDFGGLSGPRLLLASDALTLPFAFANETAGSYSCTVRAITEDSFGAEFAATAAVELSWRPCLVYEPLVSIPPVSPSCGPSWTEVLVVNTCDGTFLLDGVRVGEGSAEGFLAGPLEPVAIEPWQELRIPIAFDPEVEGALAEGTIEVISSLDPEPWSISVVSSSGSDYISTEWNQQRKLVPIDVLVVVDNGLGIGPEAVRLLAELGAAPDVFRGYDYHLAVTTTGSVRATRDGCFGGGEGGEDGRLFPVDGSRPRVVTRSTPDARAVWEQNLAVGACHTVPSRALEMAALAVSPELNVVDDLRHPEENDGNAGFLRDGVPLVVIVVSDRDDASPDTPASYLDALRAAKNGDHWLVNTVIVAGDPETGCIGDGGVAASAGNRLHQFAVAGWGIERSICDRSWGLMDLFDDDLVTCFQPKNAPADWNGDGVVDEGDLAVEFLSGGIRPIPPVDPDGTPNWNWKDGRVCFTPDAVPPPEMWFSIKRLYSPVP